MVDAVAVDGEAGPAAVHRPYLAEPGRTAHVTPETAMPGPARGGAVRLSDGTGPLVGVEGLGTALGRWASAGARCAPATGPA